MIAKIPTTINPMESPPRPPDISARVKRRSLAWVLTFPFVSLSCAAVVVAGALSLWAGERSVQELSDRLHLQLRERIRGGLAQYFEQPKRATRLFLMALNSGLVSPQNLQQVGQYSWQLRQAFDASYINFGLATGEFAGSGVGRDGLIVGERSAALGWRYEEYRADRLGRRQQRLGVYSYDHRKEPWYQAAIRRNRPSWSAIYAWDSTPEFVSINYAVPFRDRNGQPIGAIGVDLLLARISAMLKELNVHPELTITILERNGNLVASSNEQPLFVLKTSEQGSTLERITARTSNDLRLVAAFDHLNQKGGLGAVVSPLSETFQVDHQTYLLWTSPWRDPDGLDWVIVATVPRSAFMGQIEANRRVTTLLCGLVIVLAVFLGLVMARRLGRPVQSLAGAAGQLAAGQLNHRAETFDIRELDELAQAFNRMADHLRNSLIALESANQTLESRVTTRTADLAQALENLKSAQAQLIQTEKMSSLGQMVAGIAHEINNPVAFIHGNLGVLRQYIEELTDCFALLGLTQSGNGSGAIDPAAGATIDTEELTFVLDDLPNLIQSMEEGTRRIQEIVQGLRNFSRLDQVDLKPVSLHDGLDSTLLMLSHRLKRYSDRPEIRVVKQYGDLQPVWCYPGQLNQVFINLLSNAIEALDQAWQQQIAQQSSGETAQWTPTITLQTVALKTDQGPQAELVIQDNGIGISETIRHRLFDPFFTTKPVGKGTGLGLAIAYQIVVDRHGGQINCESTLGKGTTFRLRLPVGRPATDPIA